MQTSLKWMVIRRFFKLQLAPLHLWQITSHLDDPEYGSF